MQVRVRRWRPTVGAIHSLVSDWKNFSGWHESQDDVCHSPTPHKFNESIPSKSCISMHHFNEVFYFQWRFCIMHSIQSPIFFFFIITIIIVIIITILSMFIFMIVTIIDFIRFQYLGMRPIFFHLFLSFS